MIHGEQITITRRQTTGRDGFNNPITTTSSETVDNVLIAPGSQSNNTDSLHPEGVTVAYTLYFPRSWEYKSLRGCTIRIDGIDYTVIGDPRPWDGGMTPTQWNLVVTVSDKRG